MKPLVFFDNHEIIYGDIKNIRRMIFESDGKLFFIADDVEKLKDIMSMPDYIRIDWLNYNKYPLQIKHIDHIIQLSSKLPLFINNKANEDREIILQTLRSIRRDFILSCN